MYELIVTFALVVTSPAGVSSDLATRSSIFQLEDACEVAASKLTAASQETVSSDARTNLAVSAVCIRKTAPQAGM